MRCLVQGAVMIELRVLGALRLTAPNRDDVANLTRQARRAALLAYLAAATPRGSHRRDKLLALFWPELDQARARAALNQAVYVLRATLGEEAIVPRGDGALGLTDVVWCDAVAFEAALDAGNVGDALALYRGDLLDGFFISGAPEFEHWLDGERARLRERASEAAWALAETRAAAGDVVDAERWARRAADLVPADEARVRRLMTFLLGLGDRAAAVRAYEVFVARLRQEYELEPSAETEALAASLRREEQHAAAPHALTPVSSPIATVQARPGHRRRLGWVAASVAVVAALAAGGWVALHSREWPPRTVVRFTLEFPSGQQVATGIGGTTIALSPDGSELVYLGRGPQGNQLFLRPLDRVEALPIPHTRGAYLPFYSPDGTWVGFVMANTIRKVPAAGGPAITVCQVELNVTGASWGPNDVIVFSTARGLWRVPASGGQPRVLAAADTARGERYRWPDVLPNGRAAVFTRTDETGFHLAAVSSETGAVVPLGLDGTSPRFVAPGYLIFGRPDGALLAAAFDQHALRITGPAFPIAEGVLVSKLGTSRDGALAYVAAPRADRSLVLVNRDGRAETLPLSPQRFTNARFSPDGRRIATDLSPPGMDQPDIWVLDRVAGTFRRLTFDSGSYAPVWSPDGSRLAFASKPGGRPFGSAIRWISSDGAGPPETLLPFNSQFPAAFTPDGRLLVEINDPVTAYDVWIVSPHGPRGREPYLRGPSEEHSPAPSPDGQWLAYVSDESGRDEVYVRAFPTPGAPVLVSSAGGREPRWAPSGREVFYRSEKGMVAVAVNTAPSFRVGRAQVLFDDKRYLAHPYGTAYDVDPAGRFLMIQGGTEGPQVVVALNWLAQLRGPLATR